MLGGNSNLPVMRETLEDFRAPDCAGKPFTTQLYPHAVATLCDARLLVTQPFALQAAY